MPTRKKKKIVPTIDDLVEIARQVNLPRGAFDGELREASNDEADMIYKDIESRSLNDQLEFLYHRGFQMGRLEELIREISAEGMDEEAVNHRSER